MTRGFSTIELLISISVVAVLATLAVPSYRDFIEKSRLRGAAEAVYEQLQYARSQSLKRSRPIIVDISANNNTTWALGMTDDADGTTGCDAAISSATVGSCTLEYDNDTTTDYDGDGSGTDPVLIRLEGADFSNVTMKGSIGSSPSFGITTGPRDCKTVRPEETCFEPVKGLARSTINHIQLSSSSYTLQIEIDALGKIKVCIPPSAKKFIGYKDC